MARRRRGDSTSGGRAAPKRFPGLKVVLSGRFARFTSRAEVEKLIRAEGGTVAMFGWVQASLDSKPQLDAELAGDTLLRYKGAEAGDIDWRPVETVPEDYDAM